MTDERLEPVAVPPAEEMPPTLPMSRYAKAGRLGAERVHELTRLGLEYEREHGLSRGRQRQKQLIQLGRRYEAEHGLAAPARRKRKPRERVWADFLTALAAVVKPAFRMELEAVLKQTGAGRPLSALPAPPSVRPA